ncbi:MAG: hypothetical protein AB1478_04450 [Nitrospirota bacterium]
MDIANNPEKGDITVDKDGLKVFLEQNANILLSDATIDFLDGQGFVVTGMPQSPCCG